MRTLAAAVLAVLLVGASSGAQDKKGDAHRSHGELAVLAAAHGVTDAIRANNADALSDLLADDYMFVSARGAVLDKKAQVAAFRTGATHFDALTTSDEHVEMSPEMAAVTLVRHQTMRSKAGPNAPEVRAIQVFEHRHGRWLLVLSQQTNIQP